jgi:NADPH:quinone reductase-like Zn-dependent oxidoreductase
MFKPKRQMLGGDLFGTVEAVGPGVTLLAVPAEVPTIGTSNLLGFDCMFILDSRI